MRIDGMDATGKIPEYTYDLPQVHATVQAPELKAPGAGQKEKSDFRTPLEPEMPDNPASRLVRDAVDKANRQMMARETSIQFEAYDRTNDVIVRVIDTNTKEVIREIPSKKILDMVANMLEMAGLLVDERR